MSIVLLAIPLLINVAAIWSLRGGFRYAAIIPLPFLVLAYAVDVNGVIQGGNLAGLFTIIAAGPTLLLLLVLSAVQSFRKPDGATSDDRTRLSQRVSMIALTLLAIVAIGVVILVLLPGR
jgi:hypothetical protein